MKPSVVLAAHVTRVDTDALHERLGTLRANRVEEILTGVRFVGALLRARD